VGEEPPLALDLFASAATAWPAEGPAAPEAVVRDSGYFGALT
jgi:hypothetical protein